jgi:DNA-directed RNA polymerase III subunit RPC6
MARCVPAQLAAPSAAAAAAAAHAHAAAAAPARAQPVLDATLAGALPGTTVEARAGAYNALLAAHRLQVFAGDEGQEPRYRAMAAAETYKYKGLTSEDALVLQVIENAGNVGIWTRDIKQRTNVPQARVNRTLRLLEDRLLVKHVKSVQHASRKVYMLANLTPAEEISGGPWYRAEDNQPDQEFIEALRRVVLRRLEGAPRSLADLTRHISTTGVSIAPLSMKHMDHIMRTLVLDELVQEVEGAEGADAGARVFRREAAPPGEARTRLTSVPCGVCPVFDACHDGGVVSPERCQYYAEWLAALEF